MQARGMFHSTSPPSGGEEVVVPAMLPVLHGTPGGTRWAGPELGEHTVGILRGELGMSDEDIGRLREAGAI
jgi:crotonobetainyl-CoA:carnitine CoA-transferase CaiB-like acyl-CoA transferase